MTISQRLAVLQSQIQEAKEKGCRTTDSVRILAVSKQHSSETIREAFAAGLQHFGENYVQEALEKQNQLSDLPLCWHFIGAIQKNKTKAIASHFDWVHTVSSLSIAERLNQARPPDLPALNVCIQLNIDNESTKSGLAPVQALELAKAILRLPRLKLRGLMVIPAPQATAARQHASFLRVTAWFHQMNQHLISHPMDTLSMGMSSDFAAAIEAGSSIVRIGTALFGKRH